MTDADYVDDPALLTNIPALAESLLQSLKQAAEGIGLYVKAEQTEFMCFKQERTISTESGQPLKFVDQFTYLGDNISSALYIHWMLSRGPAKNYEQYRWMARGS